MFDLSGIVSYVSEKLYEHYSEKRRSPCGVDCIWIDLEEFLGQNLGVKVWKCKGEFEDQKNKHMRAMVDKIGPRVYDELEVTIPYDGYQMTHKTYKGLLMEKLDVVHSIANQKFNKSENYRDWRDEMDRLRDMVGLGDNYTLFHELKGKIGLSISDMHCENWGFVRGEEPSKESFRIIDLGYCTYLEKAQCS